MISFDKIEKINTDAVPIDPFWNIGEEKELKMHRIHAYPAKFPAFITTKALGYAKQDGLSVNRMADIFCGCGTVAFEAKRNNIDFWGCDINPVATLIARAKSKKYSKKRLEEYLDSILNNFYSAESHSESYVNANDRLKYWYEEDKFCDIHRLKSAIEAAVPVSSEYRYFFLCAFSNILKASSRWLTKSIKPQVDPEKKPIDVLLAFKEQCKFMISANEESDAIGSAETKIVTANFLDESVDKPRVDMIVTSPPYVTSYEYADLHQLSSLWLGYVNDYRILRNGSIGSLYHQHSFEKEMSRLNATASKVVACLVKRDKSKARAVTKYFLDMQRVTRACYSMLSDDGLVLFVIGNTEYKGVRIDNAKHLSESLLGSGFKKILMTKRKITRKILTPYRDKYGQFSSDGNSKKIYSEEFIVIGRKS
jgi:methylase of polypeptide subunit release factors